MNEDIMLLSNQLIYDNRLRCGSDDVAKQGLVIPNTSATHAAFGASKCEADSCWIESLLKEELVTLKPVFGGTR